MTPFVLDVSTEATRATLHLAGELDVSSAPTLRDTVIDLVNAGTATLVFDCSDLEFVDSTGLGVFIGARARALAVDGSVTLVGVRPALQRLLAVTGIDGLFPAAAAA